MKTNKMDYNAVLTTCRFGTSEVFFTRADSLVSDDNARQELVGLTLALDYTYSRVLEMSFCTHLNGEAIFLWCHPTYGVGSTP